jgi:hypothetical protein
VTFEIVSQASDTARPADNTAATTKVLQSQAYWTKKYPQIATFYLTPTFSCGKNGAASPRGVNPIRRLLALIYEATGTTHWRSSHG